MIPAIPQPDPVPLPAPVWLLWALLLFTFLLHVIAMNLVLGGSLLAAIARVRSQTGDRPHEARLAQFFVKAAPVLLSATVTFGVAALLFLQVLYGRVFFASAVLMGWWWLGVIPLLVLAYYASYLLAFREHDLGPAGTILAWLIAAIAGLIALIYGNNMTLMLKPQEMVALYASSGRGLHLNLLDMTLLPRHLHTLCGAIAVSGMAVAVVAAMHEKEDPDHARWGIRYGAAVAAVATGLNIFAGMWWLAALPRDVMQRFMGQDMTAMVVLLLGILLTITGVGLLLLATASKRAPRTVVVAAAHLLVGIALMLLTRDTVRAASLAQAGFQPANWIMPQWGPILIFIALLVISSTSVVWMVRALARGR
ncbi:MAG: hypothetical protein AB1806_15750 [Acidobacteriota bacterium]